MHPDTSERRVTAALYSLPTSRQNFAIHDTVVSPYLLPSYE